MSGKGGKRISVFDRLGPGNDEDGHVSIPYAHFYSRTSSTFQHLRLVLPTDEFPPTNHQKKDTQPAAAQGSPNTPVFYHNK